MHVKHTFSIDPEDMLEYIKRAIMHITVSLHYLIKDQ